MSLSSHLWFFLAVGAAVCWGLGYTLAERVLKEGLSPYAFLTFAVAGQLIAYPLIFYFMGGDFKAQFALFKIPNVLFFTFAAMALFAVGNSFVFSSMQLKNASLASMIEIAYPLLVVAFSWLLFREVHVNFYTFLGGVLIISGVSLIFIKS